MLRQTFPNLISLQESRRYPSVGEVPVLLEDFEPRSLLSKLCSQVCRQARNVFIRVSQLSAIAFIRQAEESEEAKEPEHSEPGCGIKWNADQSD